MSAHTPGPWFVNGPWYIQSSIPTELPVMIAQVLPSRISGIEQREANAALIAAAPELLEALEAALRRWDNADEADDPWLGNLMRQAVAKAKGGAR